MAGGTPSSIFVFPHLSGWVRLGDNGIERSHFDAKIGKWESVGGLPKSQKKTKSSELSPHIVENDATSGESILHMFLASQLPHNAKIQLLAEIRPKKNQHHPMESSYGAL